MSFFKWANYEPTKAKTPAQRAAKLEAKIRKLEKKNSSKRRLAGAQKKLESLRKR